MAKITSKTRLQGTTPEDNIKPSSEAKQDDIVLAIESISGLEIPVHDYIALTYVAAGNGVGEIETVVYRQDGAGGTIVATLTLSYNGDNEISSITKT